MTFDYGLLAKYLAGDISSDEMEEVIDWSNLSSENKKIFSEVMRLHVSWDTIRYKDTAFVDQALMEVNKKIDGLSRKRLLHKVMQYAAVLLFLFFSSYGGYKYFKSETPISIVVKPGIDIKKVVLADGTSVWLKGGSTLKYPKSFSNESRQVSLQGEAFFEVTKNMKTQALFNVFTDYNTIQVRGTSFDVKVDEKNKTVETILVSGRIEMLDMERNKVMDVSPGEKVTYSYNENEYRTEAVDINIQTAWRLRQFVFENTTLREIVNKLSVKFNVNINIESSALAQRKFRCVINEDEELVDILNLLEYLAPIRYKVEGKEVFIYERTK